MKAKYIKPTAQIILLPHEEEFFTASLTALNQYGVDSDDPLSFKAGGSSRWTGNPQSDDSQRQTFFFD